MGEITERIFINPKGEQQISELIRILPDEDEIHINLRDPLPVSKEARRLSEGLDQWNFGVYFDSENIKRLKSAGFYDPVGNNVVVLTPDARVFRHEATHAMVWNLSYADQSELVRIFSPFEPDLGRFYQHLVGQSESYAYSLSGETEVLDIKAFVRVNGGGGLIHRKTFTLKRVGEKPILISTIAVIDELLAYHYDGDNCWSSRLARKAIDRLGTEDRELIEKMGIGVFPWREVLKRIRTLKVGDPHLQIKIG